MVAIGGISAAAVLALGLLFGARALAKDDSAAVTPVLVELFTSEGCSDCPPADALLEKLDAEQFVSGVHAIVLSEHVTYWNHEGWRDPFSLEQMDWRQDEYQARFGLKQVYTPQMVLDGTQQFVGNSPTALEHAMRQALSAPKQSLEIAGSSWEKDAVHFSVKAPAPQGEHLYAALAEDVTRSEVTAGENAGRALHHVAVVRVLKDFKSNYAAGKELSLPTGNLDKGKDSGRVRLVLFLEDTKNGHVLGTTEKMLTRP
jgi:hypothetical protein